MSTVMRKSQERGPIVEVSVRPGMPVRTRTMLPSRTVSGVAFYADDSPVELRGVVAVESKLPSEYRGDCQVFADAIGQQLVIQAERSHDRTYFQLCDCWRLIHLDVSDCNHLPTIVHGSSQVDNGLESVECHWTAILARFTQVDESAYTEMSAPTFVASYSIRLRGAA